MATWLIDTALLSTLRSPKANGIRVWAEANQASLYLSAASLFEIARAIARTPASQAHKREQLWAWVENLSNEFSDRIHALDAETALRAGPLVSNLTNGHIRHRFPGLFSSQY